MKLLCAVAALSFFAGSSLAFVQPRAPLFVGRPSTTVQMADTAEEVKIFDQEQFIAESKEMRLNHLEEQAMYALKIAVENYGNAVFRKFCQCFGWITTFDHSDVSISSCAVDSSASRHFFLTTLNFDVVCVPSQRHDSW